MAGRSGIGVLVTGFSRVGALKKHAPLVFSANDILFYHAFIKVTKTGVDFWLESWSTFGLNYMFA